MPQDQFSGDGSGSGSGDDRRSKGQGGQLGGGGRVLVEPTGYAATSFLSTAGLTGGIGLAPDGLLLAAAAILLSVIEWRRLRAANPWLRLETPDDFSSPEGKISLRYSAWGSGIGIALAVVALVLVQTEGQEAAAIGPAMVSGVAALVLNLILKRQLAKPIAPSGLADDDLDDDAEQAPPGFTAARGDADVDLDADIDADTDDEVRGDRDAPVRSGREADLGAATSVWTDLAAQPDRSDPGRGDSAPDPDQADDGFREQDETALHGKLLEPRGAPKTRVKRGARRRDKS